MAGEKDKLMYKSYTNELFSHINIPVDALLCTNIHCKEHDTCIINCIQFAEKECIPFESFGKSFHGVPGWNEYVKDRHAVARDAFWLWNLYGRPNQGHLYHSMRSSRAQFKYALNLFSTNIPYMEHHFHELTLAQWCRPIFFRIINALLP